MCYNANTKDEPIVHHRLEHSNYLRCLRFQWSLSIDLVTKKVRFVFVANVCCSIRMVLRDIWGNFINCKQTIYFYILTVVTPMLNMRILLNREPVNGEAPQSWEKIRNKCFLHSSIYAIYYVNTQLTNDSILFFFFFLRLNLLIIHSLRSSINDKQLQIYCGSHMLHMYSILHTYCALINSMCVNLLWFFFALSFLISIWYAKLQVLRLESTVRFVSQCPYLNGILNSVNWNWMSCDQASIAVLRLCYWYMQ